MNEEPTFKVVDKRQFNSDGTPRESGDDQKYDLKSEHSTVSDTAQQTAHQVLEEQPIASGNDKQETHRDDQTDQTQEADFNDPASFVNFLMSLASNAAASLGIMEHPVTGLRDTDLPLAKHWIDVISMLREKTAGNLHPHEQQMLDGLLADMRMQYVSLINTSEQSGKSAWTGADITGGK